MRHCDQCGKCSSFAASAGWTYGFANSESMVEGAHSLWMHIFYANAGSDDREDAPRRLPGISKAEDIKRFDLCSAACFMQFMKKHFAGARQ